MSATPFVCLFKNLLVEIIIEDNASIIFRKKEKRLELLLLYVIDKMNQMCVIEFSYEFYTPVYIYLTSFLH